MTPLETLADLLARAGHGELQRWVRWLAAREETRMDSFWSDLAGPRLFGAKDSVASLVWDDPESAKAAHRALFLIAEDLELRGLASAESSAWFARQGSAPR